MGLVINLKRCAVRRAFSLPTAMTRPTLFISDLHLSPADPATVAAWQTFLRTTATQAAALYILGDLFEYWLGDDQLSDPFDAAIAADLLALVAQGVAVYFMPGNRDFLPGPRFAAASGVQILPDPTLIELDGERILLAHGDAYCTDDVAYQRYRRLARNRLVHWLWLHTPRRWRDQQAAKLRARSQQMNRVKSADIMDVNPAAITAALQAYTTRVMIHGHTHKPARHTYPAGTRWVLPDWHAGAGGYLRWEAGLASLHGLTGAPWPLAD